MHSLAHSSPPRIAHTASCLLPSISKAKHGGKRVDMTTGTMPGSDAAAGGESMRKCPKRTFDCERELERLGRPGVPSPSFKKVTAMVHGQLRFAKPRRGPEVLPPLAGKSPGKLLKGSSSAPEIHTTGPSGEISAVEASESMEPPSAASGQLDAHEDLLETTTPVAASSSEDDGRSRLTPTEPSTTQGVANAVGGVEEMPARNQKQLCVRTDSSDEGSDDEEELDHDIADATPKESEAEIDMDDLSIAHKRSSLGVLLGIRRNSSVLPDSEKNAKGKRDSAAVQAVKAALRLKAKVNAKNVLPTPAVKDHPTLSRGVTPRETTPEDPGSPPKLAFARFQGSPDPLLDAITTIMEKELAEEDAKQREEREKLRREGHLKELKKAEILEQIDPEELTYSEYFHDSPKYERPAISGDMSSSKQGFRSTKQSFGETSRGVSLPELSSTRERTFSGSQGFTGMEADAVRRLRKHLKSRFGSLKKAFKALDTHGRGYLSYADFKGGLDRLGVHWSEVAGYNDLQKLFEVMDSKGMGELTLTTMTGDFHDGHDERVDWQFLTTMEKWTRWCDNTRAHPESMSARPLKQADEDINSIRCTLEAKRERDRVRMRRMISQGLHRTRAGLHLTAWHLPKELNAHAVQRHRRIELEKVEQKSKRIREVLNKSKMRSQELRQCSQALRDVEAESRRQITMEAIHEHRKAHGLTKGGLSLEMVNMFCEEQLSFEEQHARNLARSLGIPIPDVEAIQAQFDVYNKDGRGITFENFPHILRALLGPQELTDVKVNEMWRAVDTDGSGTISLADYLVWHHSYLGAPKLGQKAPKRASITNAAANPTSPKAPAGRSSIRESIREESRRASAT